MDSPLVVYPIGPHHLLIRIDDDQHWSRRSGGASRHKMLCHTAKSEELRLEWRESVPGDDVG